MFWREPGDKRAHTVPGDVVDLAFRIRCPTLPLDHAYALSAAMLEVLPWLDSEPDAGIHSVHGAASGNGWQRPEGNDEVLHLPKRTRLYLRLPGHRLADAGALCGETLDINGHEMAIGESTVRPLGAASTLFARHVAVATTGGDEQEVMSQLAAQLSEIEIAVRKLMCGMPHCIATPHGDIATRSVMVAELDLQDAVTLQQKGLGPHRTVGCGLFLPHKSIAATGGAQS
ncbi:MAG: type I-MYXAN CRISPR-associated protein Cas6/Cmx6 [Gammaproteobacteria bacterium]